MLGSCFLLSSTMQNYSTPDFSTFLSRYIDLNYPRLPNKEIEIPQRKRNST